MCVTIVDTLLLISEYDECEVSETYTNNTLTIMVFAWIASFFGYLVIWKINTSYYVIKLNIIQKLLWFISSKLIIFICGASFVRVIYLSEINPGSDPAIYCYCNDTQLNLAGMFTIIYMAIFPLGWILNKLKVPNLYH